VKAATVGCQKLPASIAESRNVWHQTELLNAAKIDSVLLQTHSVVMSLE
jgi:hypothetical protein